MGFYHIAGKQIRFLVISGTTVPLRGTGDFCLCVLRDLAQVKSFRTGRSQEDVWTYFN